MRRTHLRPVVGLLVGAILSGSFVLVSAAPAGASTCSADSRAAWSLGCDVAGEAAGVIVEKVAYPSGGGIVYGIVCRPTSPGPHPVLVLNHAAGDGLTQSETGACTEYALRQGYVVLASSYRAADATNLGQLLCLGEVADVLAMVDRARTLPFVDDSQILMRGVSLGGCVTLRAYQLGVPGLRAAAAVNVPTDMAGIWANSSQEYDSHLCGLLGVLNKVRCAVWKIVRDSFETVLGGPPNATTQAAYAVRSPDSYLPAMAATDVPLIIVQGGADEVVPPTQTCAFVAGVNALPNPASHFRSARFASTSGGYALTGAPPDGCAGVQPWEAADNPVPSFPGNRWFVVYDGLEHLGPTYDYGVGLVTADAFLFAKAAKG